MPWQPFSVLLKPTHWTFQSHSFTIFAPELEPDVFPSSLVSARRDPSKRHVSALNPNYPQLRARLLRSPTRELGVRLTPSATCVLQTRDEVPEGAFFLFFSKGFSEAIRLSETGGLV